MTMKTLWCDAGKHNWERPAQRGRTPINCPEHQPETIVGPDGLTPLNKARLAKQTRKNTEWQALKDRVDEIINSPKMNERLSDRYSTDARQHTVSKLKYLVSAVENGRGTRPPHEVSDLESMIKRILEDPYNRVGHLL